MIKMNLSASRNFTPKKKQRLFLDEDWASATGPRRPFWRSGLECLCVSVEEAGACCAVFGEE